MPRKVSRPGRTPGPTVGSDASGKSGWKKTRPRGRCRAAARPAGVSRPPGKRRMFTGLIEGVGSLASRGIRDGDARLRIATGTLPFDAVAMGESIAVNGVCLTVVAFDEAHFDVDAS